MLDLVFGPWCDKGKTRCLRGLGFHVSKMWCYLFSVFNSNDFLCSNHMWQKYEVFKPEQMWEVWAKVRLCFFWPDICFHFVGLFKELNIMFNALKFWKIRHKNMTYSCCLFDKPKTCKGSSWSASDVSGDVGGLNAGQTLSVVATLGPGGTQAWPSCWMLQVFESTSFNSVYQHVIWTKCCRYLHILVGQPHEA